MESFGNLLKEYVNMQDLSVYMLAKETGIDRSFIQNIFSNKKKMPLERFQELICPKYFTSAQIQALCKAYFAEKYGIDKMERLKYIENGLKGEYKASLKKAHTAKQTEIKTNILYTGKGAVLDVIYSVLCNSTSLQSNFSFENTDVNRIIYHFCQKNKFENFFHYVSTNKGVDCHNLQIVFNTLHYAEIGYETHIYDNSDFNNFMPYYILTENYFLQFDKTAENAFILDSNNVIEFFDRQLVDIQRKCKKKIYITKNPFEFMQTVQSGGYNGYGSHTISFDNQFCPLFITKEILEEIKTTEVMNIPNAIEQILKHYELLNGMEIKSTDELLAATNIVMTHSSIANFIKDGRIASFPARYAKPVPPKYRKTLLERALNHPNYKLQITNPILFSSDYQFVLSIYENKLQICTANENSDIDTFVGNANYISLNDSTASDFVNFIDYYKLSELTYTENASRKLLSSMIYQITD